MNCDLCHRATATIHIQEVIEGKRKTLHMCAECAAEKELAQGALKGFSLAEFLANFAGVADELVPSEPEESYPEITCPSCGLTTEDFRRDGRFGCATCYEAFEPILQATMATMAMAARHAGKTPGQALASETAERSAYSEAIGFQADVLQRELQDAIAVENFEKAARLRDEIQRLRAASGGR